MSNHVRTCLKLFKQVKTCLNLCKPFLYFLQAETLKLKLEQTQRERRLAMEESGTKHTPNWFVKKDDKSNAQWTFKSEAQKNYWNQRNEAKFSADMIDLW